MFAMHNSNNRQSPTTKHDNRLTFDLFDHIHSSHKELDARKAGISFEHNCVVNMIVIFDVKTVAVPRNAICIHFGKGVLSVLPRKPCSPENEG